MMKQKKTRDRIVIVAFLLYLVALAYFLLLTEMMGRTQIKDTHLNLELFKEIKRFWIFRHQLGFRTVFLNLFGNVLGFVPFGFIVPYLFSSARNVFVVVFMTACLSAVMEMLQYLLKVGSLDVDDILLNTIGGLVGCLFYYITRIIYKKRKG